MRKREEECGGRRREEERGSGWEDMREGSGGRIALKLHCVCSALHCVKLRAREGEEEEEFREEGGGGRGERSWDIETS